MAWSGGLKKRGEMDGNEALSAFGAALEEESIQTVESGIMTADLEKVAVNPSPHVVTGLQFIDIVRKRLAKRLGAS